MAWAFGDGFDCYAAVADAANGYWDSVLGGTITLALNAAGRFSGSRSVVNAGGNNTPYLTKTSSVNDAVHHLVVAFQQTSALSGSTSAMFVTIYDGATAQCSVVFRNDGAILLTAGAANGTTLTTYTGAVTTISTWFAFEIEVFINNTAGYMKVRKNGNVTEDFTSALTLDTQASANAYANKIGIGCSSGTPTQHFDDLYWRSDASSVAWMGDIRCYTRAPASDAAVQFSRTPTGVLTQTIGASGQSLTAISIAAYSAFTAGWSGTVTSVGVSFAAAGNAVNAKCAIFADNGSGAPGTLLASATAPVTPVVTGTNTFAFSGVSVVKGVQYWIGVCADGTATTGYTCSTGNVAGGTTGSSSYAAFPQTSPVTSGANKYVNMAVTYTATPANWQAVSEAQQDATTSYVYDSVPGHADLYGIAPIASTPLTTFAVTTRAYAIKSDAGTRTAAVQLKSGASTVASPTVVLTPSNWQWAWRHDTLDPATSAPWTAAAVNLVNIGPLVVA